MNRFTNNLAAGLAALLLVTACSGTLQTAQPSVQNSSTQTVEQPVVTVQNLAQPTAEKPAQTLSEKPKVSAKAQVSSSAQVIERLKAWDKNLLFLQTSFTQITSYDGVEISRSHGTLFYDKNKHLLRLDTLGAAGEVMQSAVTDKKELVILDDAGRTVLKGSWKEWQQNQPNQALFDFGNYTALLERHHVKAVRPNQFALTPKTGESYTLYLTLSPEDAFPTSLKLEADGMSTQADLINTQKNKPLSQTVFGGVFK